MKKLTMSDFRTLNLPLQTLKTHPETREESQARTTCEVLKTRDHTGRADGQSAPRRSRC